MRTRSQLTFCCLMVVLMKSRSDVRNLALSMFPPLANRYNDAVTIHLSADPHNITIDTFRG